MRTHIALISLTALAFTACSSGLTADDGKKHGTGFYKNNVPYVTDDGRVQDDLNKRDDTPVSGPTPAPNPAPQVDPATKPDPKAPVPTGHPLREHLREFEISRYSGGTVARFGNKVVEIKIFFDNQPTAVFKAALGSGSGGGFTMNATSGKFQLSGSLKDTEPTLTLGEFTLAGNGETAKIFYRAYKAGLTVREDASKKPLPGSITEKQIRALGDGTFAWVNNWAVVRGRAVYLIDIVKVSGNPHNVSDGMPFFAFKGESLQTGEQEQKADTVGGTADVSLVGNGEENSGKMFSVKLDDPTTHEKTEVMVDVDMINKPEERIAPEDRGPEIPAVTDDNGYAPTEDGQGKPSPNGRPKKPKPTPGETHRQPDPSPITGNAYLKIDTSLRRTARMVRDFNQNRQVPGVRDEIANYQRNRGTLDAFYTYANPFRRMIQAIGRAFDVSPAYAYLTVIESTYFAGHYFNKDNSGVALGIFQFKTRTAESVGLRTGGSGDERYYFAPSACGAAKYIGNLVESFGDGDTTMAILGYNQGEGGAAAAIFCSLGDTGNRKECASRINHGMSGSEYARYIKLAKNYHYKYAEIERVAAISAAMRSYVNRKLAIYFISSNMSQYGFSIPSDAPNHLPGNNSVMPPAPILDTTCRATLNSL